MRVTSTRASRREQPVIDDRGGHTGDTDGGLADGERMDSATETFVAHRNLLFTVAYEMLGSAADAEDVLQETWLRWTEVDLAAVRDRRAYLVRITTRQALNRLRALGRRKESYVGPWLPEPLLTAPDVAEDVELADSMSMAMMLVLETLAPTERAVFVLREVFDLGYDEIAEAVGKSPAAVRQIAHRARSHVAARRPRGVVSRTETQGALDAFRRAAETGDLQGLLDILAPDIVYLADGGGIRKAVLRPVVGADKVGRLLTAAMGRISARGSLRPAQVNGHPALLLHAAGEVDTVLAVTVTDGLVTGLYAVRNPEKLSHMRQEMSLRR
jgi:RNA polymerase sigma-70 factor (ECF subfamily)